MRWKRRHEKSSLNSGEGSTSRNRCAMPAATSSFARSPMPCKSRSLAAFAAPARRELLAIAKGEPVSAQTSRIRIKPGTRLLREWHGTTHEVLVTDQGFVWDGATYRSLSAIAFAITGAKWNGHRFFGLVKGRGGANG